MGLIYMATNKVNGKSYIGLTTGTLENRCKQHKSQAKRVDGLFQRAINKYGWDNFSWEILEDGIDSIDELNKREIYYIDKYDTFNKGYNMTLGGEGIKIPYLKYSKDDVLMVTDELIKGEKSCVDISKGLGIGLTFIYTISNGQKYTDLWDYEDYLKDKVKGKFLTGDLNPMNKHSKETWNLVKNDICNTNLTFTEIGNKYGIHRKSISRFNYKKIRKDVWGEDINPRLNDDFIYKFDKTKDDYEDIFKLYFIDGISTEKISQIKSKFSRGEIKSFVSNEVKRLEGIYNEFMNKYKGKILKSRFENNTINYTEEDFELIFRKYFVEKMEIIEIVKISDKYSYERINRYVNGQVVRFNNFCKNISIKYDIEYELIGDKIYNIDKDILEEIYKMYFLKSLSLNKIYNYYKDKGITYSQIRRYIDNKTKKYSIWFKEFEEKYGKGVRK